ncbi:MAG: NAD(P)-binding domain-containing protein [Ginsengibacter sp.]
MHTKQTIMIIGASSERGSFIAKSLSQGNYRLLLNDRDNVRLNELREEIVEKNSCADVETIDCSFEGCWEADIIISAISSDEQQEVANRIREVANQKIVISFTDQAEKNEELQALLPYSKVLTMDACAFSGNIAGRQQIDVLMAGDNEEALQTVTELFTPAGFKVMVKQFTPEA